MGVIKHTEETKARISKTLKGRVPWNTGKKLKDIYFTGTKIYWVFAAMKDRCTNKNNPGYKNYGGRGIKCGWKNFEEFYRDLGNSYKEGLLLERIDNNGDYCIKNCKWVDRNTQNRNKRNNIKLNGEVAFDVSQKLGGSKRMIQQRIRRGWSLEKAFSTPKTC